MNVHSVQGFLTFHVVPVWFHVVPTALEFQEFVVWPRRGAKKRCGSRVVPCGSYWRRIAKGDSSVQGSLTFHVVPVWHGPAGKLEPTSTCAHALQLQTVTPAIISK